MKLQTILSPLFSK